MRRRLLLVLSVFAVLAVAAFAVPLLASTAAERTQRFVLSRTAALDRFAAFAQQTGSDPGDPVEALVGAVAIGQEAAAFADVYGEGVLVVDGTGRTVAAAGLTPGDDGVAAAVDAALRNQPVGRPERVTPWSADPVLFARPVGTGVRVEGAVVLRASPVAAARDVAVAWLVVLVGAVAAAAAFAGLAVLLARWALRPIAELGDGMAAVAAGHAGAHVSRSTGPPELRELAAAFNRMSDAVSRSAEQQRRLVADTSHQLRNPLAALRLRADTLERHVAPDGRRGYAAVSAEIDRLEAMLGGLLGLAAAESRATELAAGTPGPAEPAWTDVGAVVAERVEAWTPAAGPAGVRLHVDGLLGPAFVALHGVGDGEPDAPAGGGVSGAVGGRRGCGAGEGGPVVAGLPGAELAQVLDVLLDNAVKYAGAGAAAHVDWTVDDRTVQLRVRDTGPGLDPADRGRALTRFWRAGGGTGSGLGLAIAEQIVTARGGTLHLDAAPGGGLVVTVELPCAPS